MTLIKKLDRFQIICSKQRYIPLIVIKELGAFLGAQINIENYVNNKIYSSKVLEILSYIEPIELSNPYSSKDLSNIAHYVNYKKHIWSMSSLMKAFNNINKIIKDVNKVKSNFVFGNITPKTPKNIDLSLLYYISIKIGLKTIGNDSTIWVNNLRSYLNINIYQLQKNILNNLESYSKISLYNLSLGVYNKVKSIDYTNIDNIYNSCNINYIPKTDIEAVVVAAKRDGIDISEISNPLLVYYKLIENPRYINCFKKLSGNFNSKLPRCFYKENILSRLAFIEGYTHKQIKNNDPYMLCMESSYLYRFSHGIANNHINTTTAIYLTSITDLDYHESVSYGKEKQMIYTYKELLDTFTSYSDFVHPDNPNKFYSQKDIRRLRYLCSGQKYLGEKLYKYRSSLKNKINQINSGKKIVTEDVKRMITYYHNNPDIIKKVLVLLSELGMYMRGWNGKGNFPVIIAVYSDYLKVESYVRESIYNFRLFIKKEKIEFILNLPLVRYNDGRFINNTDKNKGLTIGDRLDIVIDTNNINSCIRTTSNWILATTARYSILLKIKTMFDIDQVRRIA